MTAENPAAPAEAKSSLSLGGSNNAKGKRQIRNKMKAHVANTRTRFCWFVRVDDVVVGQASCLILMYISM